MKRILILLILLFALGGCMSPSIDTLTLTGPDDCYPPCTVTLGARGVTGGQYTFEVEGTTYTQASGTLDVRLVDLPSLDEPLIVTVIWSNGVDTQAAERTIALRNSPPIIGEPEFIGVTNKEIIVPGLGNATRYIVTFPSASDPEEGPVEMVNATVYTPHWLKGNPWKEHRNYPLGELVQSGSVVYEANGPARGEAPPSSHWRKLSYMEQGHENTVFCPPYIGMNPPKPEIYHVRDPRTHGVMIENAFVFFSMWDSPLGEGNMPWMPGGWSGSGGYLGTPPGSSSCFPAGEPSPRPTHVLPSGETIITVTFEDEMGATTKESFTYPTAVYVPCGSP